MRQTFVQPPFPFCDLHTVVRHQTNEKRRRVDCRGISSSAEPMNASVGAGWYSYKVLIDLPQNSIRRCLRVRRGVSKNREQFTDIGSARCRHVMASSTECSGRVLAVVMQWLQKKWANESTQNAKEVRDVEARVEDAGLNLHPNWPKRRVFPGHVTLSRSWCHRH